ncbi:MAG: response regulator [Desulfonatronospira sp. MSAO_Bac3]|nr:MAG: response regulator [Desulfonatronospira sp. MSAO_Bac3]
MILELRLVTMPCLLSCSLVMDKRSHDENLQNLMPKQALPVLTRILLALLAILITPSPGFSQKEAAGDFSVFYLNSYHDGYAWSDDIREGIRHRFQESGHRVEIQMEYMDTKVFHRPGVTKRLLELYREKYSNEEYDIVIVSDDDALDFMLDYGDELFPGLPIVFCGINYLEEELLDRERTTGIVENFNVKRTLELALSIHQDKNRMVVIGDESTTGIAIKGQIKEAIPDFQGRLDFEFWTQYSLDEIADKVKDLPQDTLVYFIPFFYSAGGQVFSAGEVLENVAGFSDLPIYSNWEFLLGHGMVGGNLISGFEHGSIAAGMALDILEGKSPADIPIIHDIVDQNMFDYNVLQKQGIKQTQLPPESVLINEPPAFYELDKQVFWVIMSSLGALVIILAFLVRSIIHKRIVEGRIRNQLAFQESLMDTIPQLVCWKDLNQRYMGANQAFTDFFGIESPDKIMHQTDSLLMPSRDFAQWAARMDKQVLQTGQALRKVRMSVRDQDGDSSWLEVNKIPLRDEKGEIVGTLSTAENITNEINLERQLLQSQKMEAMGTLAGGISHDFNNILTSIMNSTELAQGDLDPDSPAYQDLERVLKASHRGRDLVQRILTFSRPSQEGFRPTVLPELVRDSVSLLQSSLPRNIEVRSSVSGGYEPVNVNPTQISQVVMNLCTNAFQAIQDQKGTLTINLEEIELDVYRAEELDMPAGKAFRLEISDTGPGIDRRDLDKIFDPFFTTKSQSGGTGLGLAVVLGIVKNHKGVIQVDSSPDQGTSFEILLPAREPGNQESSPSGASLKRGSGTLLFVEDDQDLLETTPRSLQAMGYSVFSASSAQKALEILGQDIPLDLVITDFDMPGLNGIELAKKIQAEHPDLPVMLITGRIQALEGIEQPDNIRLTLSKPFNQADLSQAVSTAITD